MTSVKMKMKPMAMKGISTYTTTTSTTSSVSTSYLTAAAAVEIAGTALTTVTTVMAVMEVQTEATAGNVAAPMPTGPPTGAAATTEEVPAEAEEAAAVTSAQIWTS